MIAPEARLGNDIARQFAHLPADEAAEAVARHIESFWDPRMRARLRDLAQAGDDALGPVLLAAAAHVHERAFRRETAAQPE